MLVSWNWLKHYTDLETQSPDDVAKKFTAVTAEIEEIHLPPSEEFLSQFKVVKVLEVNSHPKADRLRCCKVDTGEGVLDIVCGAPNVRADLHTILAPIGAKIGDMKIQKSKLRGELSEGMLCSEQELGVGADHSGIVELEGCEIGASVAEMYRELGPVWDLDNKAITHRPDLWGHYGIAREISALYALPLKPLDQAELPEGLGDDGFKVSVDVGDELCRRYCGLSLKGVKIAPSPLWVQRYLTDAGLRPINNVVDATNFVMLELGQPTHAFDVSRLPARNISVAKAENGEVFQALIGKEAKFSGEELVIVSGGKTVALAGVVGGENSSIDENTTEVFLEAAHFDPILVRKTAAKFDMRTDSSARFEKSLDPENAAIAIRRIVQLLRESCDSLEVASSLIDCYPSPYPELNIDLAPETVNGKLGIEIPVDRQCEILTALGFANSKEGEELKVKVPSWRNTKDIEKAIDLVEEIGRINGYENIVPTPPSLSIRPVERSDNFLQTRRLRDFLITRGYDEVIRPSFARAESLQELGFDLEGECIKLENPLGADQAYMRPSMLPQAMEVWQLNAKNYQQFKCFELGKVFIKEAGAELPRENDQLVCASCSNDEELFYEVKNDALNILEQLGVRNVDVVAMKEERVWAHPVRKACLFKDERELGYLTELHPHLAKTLGIRQRLVFFVLTNLAEMESVKNETFSALSKFPPVPFSFSLLVPQKTMVGEVIRILSGSDAEHVHDLKWEGNFSGEPIPEDKLSMTFSLEFRHTERTLTTDEVHANQERLLAEAAKHGYHLREG